MDRADSAPRPFGIAIAPSREGTIIAGALIFVAALHLHLALTRTINWDEFFYFSQIAQYARGDLRSPMQTIHVHLFGWLRGIGDTGVDGIVAGRIVMLVAEAFTAFAIIRIAALSVRREAALCAALAYLCAGYVLQHGASFRTDPLAAALVMGALLILARARLSMSAIGGFAILLGLAGMVTIKSVLLAPPFVALAFYRWAEAEKSIAMAARLAMMAAGSLLAFLVLYAWHDAMLNPALPAVASPTTATGTDAGASAATAQATAAGRYVLFFGIPYFSEYFVRMLLTSLPLIGALALFTRGLSGRTRARQVALIGLVLPFLTLFIYRNTLPYYYAFMLPPVAAGAAIGIARMGGARARAIFAIACAANAFAIWVTDGPSHQDAQARIQQAAETIFPEPVAYFDFPASLPNHRKANAFMTVWGVQSYLEAGEPVYLHRMESGPVPLLVTIDPQFNPGLLAAMERTQNERIFLPEDRAALQETYRRFWGPLWLAGTQMPMGNSTQWRVLVPGPYTVEGEITINGEQHFNGEVIELTRSTVQLETGSIPGGLIWGRNLERPAAPPPARPYWTDF